jgi:MafB19-like deaminase
LIKLAKKNGGKLPEELTMYVDRPTCNACQGTDVKGEVGRGLSILAELYGVKKLTIHDSYGTTYIIKPNQRTEVIK